MPSAAVYLLLFAVSVSLLTPPSSAQSQTACPLNFTILSDLIAGTSSRPNPDVSTACRYIQQGLRLVESSHLRLTSSFLPPLSAAESCWQSYQSLIDSFVPNFDIRISCGFQTDWISQGCMNISTRAQFDSLIPNSTLANVVSACNQSLDNNSPCASCTTSLSSLQANYLNGQSVGNVSDCTAYASIYAAAFANYLGPADKGTAKCLFLLDFTGSSSTSKKKKLVILAVLIGCGVGLLLIILAGFLILRRRNGGLGPRRRKRGFIRETEMGPELDSIKDSTTFVRYTFEDIKKATRNFSRDNIVGRGGYGNVYRGLLPNGTEVALKRFKNCSASGDANFAHEVEVIASIRHVNLVALRGYCIATTQFEGHQRIIVCDLMRNGSLYDHLFGGSTDTKLSWPLRQKIALGTARGLAYLHYGAQQMIIHRDIKASNILLDERFEAKVADFGLAKFTPENATHLTTRVAGTMGYVAPEYALYGQLTERSDVYSFGVVLLELLSGKKALLVSTEENQPSLVTDWAWSLVREGKSLDVIEDGMPEPGLAEVLEKYVLVAVLCSHPQLYARPTMDQVVKMLETDITVPSIPDRPIPLVSDIDDIERSVSSSGSGHLSTPRGFQSYTMEGQASWDRRDTVKDSSTSRSSQDML